MVPEATAAGKLYVSAENTQLDNTFGGGQIVEVIVSDSIQSEPNVTLDNYKIRMTLAQDGKWYGYIGDNTHIRILDSKVISPGIGMDYGEFCANTTPQSVLGIDISQTRGVAIPYSYDGTGSSTNGVTASQICQGGSFDSKRVNNVLLNPPALVTTPTLGNIGLQNNVWPFIQLFDFSSSQGEIILEQTGLDEIVILNYDVEDNWIEVLNIPRHFFLGEDFKLSINNVYLNIDPTSRDVWTFDSIEKTYYYRFFDNIGSFSGSQNFRFKDSDSNAKLIEENIAITCKEYITYLGCMKSQSNGFQNINNVNSIPLTFFTMRETEKNSHMFTTVDDNGKSSAIMSNKIPLESVGMRILLLFTIQDYDYNIQGSQVNLPNIPSSLTIDEDKGICLDVEPFKELMLNGYVFRFTTANPELNFSTSEGFVYCSEEYPQFQLPNNFSGVIEYTVTLEKNYDNVIQPKKITVTVLPINDAPVIASATASNSVNEDSIVSIKLDGTDIEGYSLKYVFTTNPLNGKISGTSPNITYTPNPNFNGQDVFAYKVNDGLLDSIEQKITITVNPVNDIPIAKAGTDKSVDVNSIVSLDGSSSDIDADAITYSWIQTAGYPVTLTDSKIINPKFTAPTTNGQLTFMLTVSDGKATSNPAVVSVFVGSTVPVPVPPPSPTKIVATPANGAINLKWSPPAKDGGSPIIDYVIEYKSAADTSWKTFADGKSTNTQTTITGLKNDVKYQFVISAVNSVGSGEKSTPSNAIPKSITPPPAPDPKVLADEKKAAEKKALEEKKAADKKAADKKAAEKKAADKKAAEKKAADKKAADKKAADAKKAAPKK